MKLPKELEELAFKRSKEDRDEDKVIRVEV